MSATAPIDKVSALSDSLAKTDAGKAYSKAGLYDRAQSLFAEAYRLRETALGNDDPGLAEIADDMGLAHFKAGQFEPAMKQFNQALEILEKKYYAGHAKLEPVLEHLGDCYVAQNKHSDAEPLYKRALEISEKTMSGEHRTIFELIWKLGLVYQKLSKFPEAEAVMNKAAKQLDTPLGPADEFRNQLAVIYTALGKDKEADATFRQAVEGLKQRGDYHRLADCLENFATFLKKSGPNSEAEIMLERARLIKSAYKLENNDIFPATLLRA